MHYTVIDISIYRNKDQETVEQIRPGDSGTKCGLRERKKAEMKTVRKMHQDIRIGRKKQLAVLKPLKCRYCPWRFFSNTQRYLSHVHNHATRIKSYWYKNSGFYCPQAASKLKYHSVEKTYKCHFCSRGFMTQRRKIFHEKYGHICDLCGKTFENAQAKKFHKIEYHDVEKNKICCFCSRHFETELGKARHEKYEHLCDFCEKTFQDAEVKKLHKLKYHGTEEKCRFCSRYFTTPQEKTLHEKDHHICDFCDKPFKNAKVKKNHEFECDHKCKFCSLYFFTANGKTAHEKYVHKCDFQFCKETFANRKNKKLHKRTHHKENNKCCFCSRYFTTATGKTLHEKFHRDHRCDSCDKTFKNAEVKELHKLECCGKRENYSKCLFCYKDFATHEKGAHHCDVEFSEQTFENATVKKCHKLEHHAMEKAYNFLCQFCSRCFTTEKGKALHERSVHTCDICEKTFANTVTRKLHKQECHSMETTKFCHICSRYFSTAYGKAIHEISEHKCELCEKIFENAEIKKQHKLEDHKCNMEETNKCCFCGKYFASAYGKTLHEKYSCTKPIIENANSKKSNQNQDEEHGKCSYCSRDLKPAQFANHPSGQKWHACLSCKKIFIVQPSEVKEHHEPAHDEQISDTSTSR